MDQTTSSFIAIKLKKVSYYLHEDKTQLSPS